MPVRVRPLRIYWNTEMNGGRVLWSSAFVVIAIAFGYAAFSRAVPLLNDASDASFAWGMLWLIIVWPIVLLTLLTILRSIWKG